MPPKEKSQATKPTTAEGWKSYIADGGKGRATITTIMICFNLSKKDIQDIGAMLDNRIESMEGFPALIQKCRGSKAKGPRDQTEVDNNTRKVERWLAEESAHKHILGDENTEAPEALKKEAIRKLVFDAKGRICKNVIKMENDIDEELSPTKKTHDRVPARSPFATRTPTRSLGRNSTPLFDHLKPLRTTGAQSHVHSGHRLLWGRISNLLQYNLRLIDSRTQSTITRLPFRYLVADTSILETASGGFTGDDVTRAKLVEFVQQEVPIGIVGLWKENGHKMKLTHAPGSLLADSDDFAVAVNEYINEPRAHTDLCITLLLDTRDAGSPDAARRADVRSWRNPSPDDVYNRWRRLISPSASRDDFGGGSRTRRPASPARDATLQGPPKKKKKVEIGGRKVGKANNNEDAGSDAEAAEDGGVGRRRPGRRAAEQSATKVRELLDSTSLAHGWGAEGSDVTEDEYIKTLRREVSADGLEGDDFLLDEDMDLGE